MTDNDSTTIRGTSNSVTPHTTSSRSGNISTTNEHSTEKSRFHWTEDLKDIFHKSRNAIIASQEHNVTAINIFNYMTTNYPEDCPSGLKYDHVRSFHDSFRKKLNASSNEEESSSGPKRSRQDINDSSWTLQENRPSMTSSSSKNIITLDESHQAPEHQSSISSSTKSSVPDRSTTVGNDAVFIAAHEHLVKQRKRLEKLRDKLENKRQHETYRSEMIISPIPNPMRQMNEDNIYDPERLRALMVRPGVLTINHASNDSINHHDQLLNSNTDVPITMVSHRPSLHNYSDNNNNGIIEIDEANDENIHQHVRIVGHKTNLSQTADILRSKPSNTGSTSTQPTKNSNKSTPSITTDNLLSLLHVIAPIVLPAYDESPVNNAQTLHHQNTTTLASSYSTSSHNSSRTLTTNNMIGEEYKANTEETKKRKFK